MLAFRHRGRVGPIRVASRRRDPPADAEHLADGGTPQSMARSVPYGSTDCDPD